MLKHSTSEHLLRSTDFPPNTLLLMGDPPAAGTRLRKNSKPGNYKRRRSTENLVTNAPSNKRMAGGNGTDQDAPATATAPALRNVSFDQFTHYMSTTHRADLNKDINKAVDRVSQRIDATQNDLLALSLIHI